MNYIDFTFYIKKDKEINNIIIKWMKLIDFIEVKTFRFGHPHEGIEWDYDKDNIEKILKDNLSNYEDYLLEMKSCDGQYININLSPNLKEVIKLICRFNRDIYEKYKSDIMKNINFAILNDELMLGYGHPAIYNKYFESSYGQIKFGCYWMMWFGNWALNYLNDNQIKKIKELCFHVGKTEKYICAKLIENPWEINKEENQKKQRYFMKQLKFIDSINKINSIKEFNYIEAHCEN